MSESPLNQTPAPAPAGESPLQVVARIPWLKMLLVMLVAWVALFHWVGNSTLGYVRTSSLFGWWTWTMGGIADQEHAYWIPLIVLGLFWYRREQLATLTTRVWWPALVLVGGALLLHVLGYLVQQTRISVFAFFLGLYGCTGLLWGWGWMRASFLPFSLFAFCVPLGTGVEPLTFPLRLAATTITAGLCRSLLGIDVIQHGNQLLDAAGHYQYEVAAACSGIRSLTAILVFGVIYAYLSFKSPWRRILVLLAGIPMAVVANVARLTLIVIAAEAFGQKAGDFVHENGFFSMLPYVPALGGLLLVGRFLREPSPDGAAPPKAPGPVDATVATAAGK